jgi:hypothetical protein
MQAPDECTTDHDRAQPITIDPDETANQAPRHSAGTRRIAQIPAQLLVQHAASLQRFALVVTRLYLYVHELRRIRPHRSRSTRH